MISQWQIKITGIAFLGLASAISVNALYLQDVGKLVPADANAPASEPSAAQPSSPAPKPVKTPVQSIGSILKPSMPSTTANAPRPPAASMETVKAVQRELARRGYSVGADDGRVRIITREAIIAYEFDRDLALTGEASEALLKDMLFAPVTPKSQRNADARRFEANARMIVRVQEVLSSLGFGPAAMTAQMDEATRNALRQFQANRKLAVTGGLSERVLLEICVVQGKPLVFADAL